MTNLDRVIGFQMHRKSMTQASLAARVGVSPSTVFRWLAGKAFPTVEKCQLIASVLCISEEDVIKAVKLDTDKHHPKKQNTQTVESKSLSLDLLGITPRSDEQYEAGAESVESDDVICESTICEADQMRPIIKSEGSLQTIRLRTIAEMQGIACVYKVDTGNNYIELSDSNGGTITGIIDVDQIESIISELHELLLIKHRAV